jgi:hypothetical protein
MGTPMAANLLKAKYRLVVYDIVKERVNELVEKGAKAFGKDECFNYWGNRINSVCICYNELGPNSNSVAYTLLKNCGLSTPNPWKLWGWTPISDLG